MGTSSSGGEGERTSESSGCPRARFTGGARLEGEGVDARRFCGEMDLGRVREGERMGVDVKSMRSSSSVKSMPSAVSEIGTTCMLYN